MTGGPGRWLERLVHPRWREEIVADLRDEHEERAERGVPEAMSRLRLGAALVVAAATSRWHGRRRRGDAPEGPAVPGTHGTEGGVGMTVEEVVRDVRFAVRSLRRAPLFAAVALLTLGAGMGLTLAVFAVVNGVLLRPLEYPEPDRLVLLQGQPGAFGAVTLPAHLRFLEGMPSLESAAAWQGWSPVLDDDGLAIRLSGASVSAGWFGTVGIEPAVGRFFDDRDAAPGHAPVVVLSHALWTSRWGGDPGAVGRHVQLDGERHRIVGVAPEGFEDPVSRGLGWGERALWRAEPPLFRDSEQDVGWVGFWSLGRLAEGADAERATREMRAVVTGAFDTPDIEQYAAELRAVTVRDAVVEEVRPTLLALLATGAAVLLIACANLANLMLGRAAARRDELAVRASLGAGRGRLVRQLLTESVVLAAGGALLGLALARGILVGVLALAGPALPRVEEVGVDGGVLMFAAVAALATALLFGAAPALRVTGAGGPRPGRRARGATASPVDGRLRGALVVGETALAMVLLCGAGLLLTTFARLHAVDPGIETASVVTASLRLGAERFPEAGLQTEALRSAEAAVAGLPGVVAVGAVTDLPLGGAINSTRIRRADESEEEAAARRHVLVRAVTPGWLDAVRIPLLRGRAIDAGDAPGAEEVAVVNREFVRRFYPEGDALGRRVVVRGVERRIVGVAEDVREFDLTSPESDAVLYTPYAQEEQGWMRSGVHLVARVAGDGPAERVEAVRTAVLRGDPRIVVGRVVPLTALVDAQLRIPRFRAALVLVFAGLALLLAAVGLGGVVAYAVSRRTREIGLRMALGARRSEVAGMMVRRTAALAGAGITVGLGVALLVGPSLTGFLFAVDPHEPGVLGGSALLLLAVSMVAGWLPARRAARVDPAVTLRGE